MESNELFALLSTLAATGNDEAEWRELARAALKRIARDERIKAYVKSDRRTYTLLLGAASRFIGGESLEECLPIAREINEASHVVTIDYMGESTRDSRDAAQAVSTVGDVIAAIPANGLDASVSLDLSHIGLAIDPGLALEHVRSLAAAAAEAGLELMISAEDSSRTDHILDIRRELGSAYANVGITLQANLHRTAADLHRIRELPGRVRIVKGAFEESRTVVLPRGAQLNDRYLHLVTTLLDRQHPVSIATHDTELLARILPLVDPSDTRETIEFEMLRGVGETLLGPIRAMGYRTRLYLPYGVEWYLYLCHRLAEYPPNLYRAVSDIVDRARSPAKLSP